MSWLQKIYWNHFGQPATDRALFSALLARPYDSVLEIGVGSGARMRRIAKLIQSASGNQIRYIGTDPFESANDGQPHISLKAAHQQAGQLGWRASLLPGEAAGALPRVAHKFGSSQLVIVDGGIDPAAPTSGPIGSWLDRIADESSTVLGCQDSGGSLVLIDTTSISRHLSEAA